MSEENNIMISVITVSYNAITSIEKTIQSVINQTYPNIEYIIIDGKSNDGTTDIIKKYSDKIVLMNKGKVIDFGASEDVLNCKNIKKVYGVDTDIINGYIIPK
jgi:glycosyltransferase involved in cell wall biosynthesis